MLTLQKTNYDQANATFYEILSLIGVEENINF